MDLARELVRLALEAEGAVVEDTGDGLYALLPAAAAASLSLGEEVRVAFGAGGDAEGSTVDGRLGSRLVEALAAPHLAEPPLGALILPAELPRRLPAHLPVLLNGVIAGDAVATGGVERYVVTEVRLVVQSDEMRSRIATLCFRASDGARVSTPRLAGAHEGALEPLAGEERRRLESSLRSWMQREGIRQMAGAFESVRRRLSRDLESMADFYRGLDSDMAAAARRARSDEERQRRNAKRGALGVDMAARRGQLRERTRLRLSGTVVAATLVESQVQRFTLPVRRRQQSGSSQPPLPFGRLRLRRPGMRRLRRGDRARLPLRREAARPLRRLWARRPHRCRPLLRVPPARNPAAADLGRRSDFVPILQLTRLWPLESPGSRATGRRHGPTRWTKAPMRFFDGNGRLRAARGRARYWIWNVCIRSAY